MQYINTSIPNKKVSANNVNSIISVATFCIPTIDDTNAINVPSNPTSCRVLPLSSFML